MPSFHPDGAITESKQESQAVDNATTGTQRGRYRRLCSASTSLTSEAGVLNEGPRKDSPSGAHRAPGKELVNLLMSWGGLFRTRLVALRNRPSLHDGGGFESSGPTRVDPVRTGRRGPVGRGIPIPAGSYWRAS